MNYYLTDKCLIASESERPEIEQTNASDPTLATEKYEVNCENWLQSSTRYEYGEGQKELFLNYIEPNRHRIANKEGFVVQTLGTLLEEGILIDEGRVKLELHPKVKIHYCSPELGDVCDCPNPKLFAYFVPEVKGEAETQEYTLQDMKNCFDESRLTHPMLGFKHQNFEEYLSQMSKTI